MALLCDEHFQLLLTLEDDLADVPRSSISVFWCWLDQIQTNCDCCYMFCAILMVLQWFHL